MPSEPVIHVIDDEAAFRRSLVFLLESAGWQVIGHDSAESFLAAAPTLPDHGGCLLLDVRMPRMSGFELQRHLQAGLEPWPIVFMSGHGDEEMAAHALRAGALDFLHKPFADQVVLDAVERAVRQTQAN
jgi:two-component system, LuxR family, response regulator FixJ